MAPIELFEHGHFTKKRSQWEGWQTLYDGEHDTLTAPQYLWLHEYEADSMGTAVKDDGKKARAIREQRSRYLNLIEPIVSRWISFLFRGEMSIPDSVKQVLTEEIQANIDGKGASLKGFIKDSIGTPAILLGEAITIVDTPGEKALTLADERSKGLRPYASVLSPLQVPDWSLSADPRLYGKPSFVRTEYDSEIARLDETTKPTVQRVSVVYKLEGGKYVQLKYVDRSEGRTGKDWEPMPLIPFTLDEIPVSIYRSESFVKDAAEMQLLLFNFMSAESSSINAQAFQKIFISGEQDDKRVIELNEYAINLLGEGAVVTVVEPGSTDTISGAIMRTIDWCFKVAFNQVDGLSAMSKESPSADTRRQMKDEFIALVESTLTEIEDHVASMVRHFALLMGIEPPKERITFDKSVTDADYEQELSIWQSFADQFKQVPTAYGQMLKRQAKRLGLNDMDKIEAEIDTLIAKKPEGESAQSRAELLRGIVNGDAGTEPDPATD